MKTQKHYFRIAACTIALAISGYSNAQSYQFFDLGSLNPDDINNYEQVVGSALVPGTLLSTQAAIWEKGVSTALPIDGSYRHARGINDSGQVVGYSYHASPEDRVIIWNNGVATTLGTLDGRGEYPTHINNAGQVVGYSKTDSGMHATIWNNGVATDLGTLGGTESQANSINDYGQIVGSASLYGGGYSNGRYGDHATIWNNGVATDLGTVYGFHSFANSINNAGQVVGSAYIGSPNVGNGIYEQHAIIWNNGVATALPTMQRAQSGAYDINNSGQIVGWSGTLGATLWNNGVAIDLNTFLTASEVSAGWSLGSAKAINDKGSIVGSAYNSITNETHGFLLAAVPEPESYALLLAGMGLIGAAVRRRKKTIAPRN